MRHSLIVLWILFSVGSLAKTYTLTLDDLITIALKHSPDVNIGKLDFAGAKARAMDAKGLYLPQLNLYADGGKQSSKLKAQSRVTTDLLTGTLSASQLLYDFGKIGGIIAATQEEALAYQAQMYQTISDKILAIKQIYYTILKAKGILRVQQKNLALQKQQLRRAQKYLKAGIKTIIDVSDAKVRLEQARLDLDNARYQIEYLRSQLEQIIGTVPYGGAYRIYAPQTDVTSLANKLPQNHPSLSRLEAFAYRHRALLEGAQHFIKGARAQVESAKGGYLPTLSLRGDHTVQKVDESLAGVLPQEQSRVSLSLEWNLFSGFRTDAQVEEAKVGVLKAASQAQKIKLAVKQQVLGAHIQLRQNRNNVRLNARITDAAHHKLIQAQKRYENDLGDFIELQNAQQDYIRALSNLVNSYYDYYIALARLDHAIGR
ncbi:MAG: TolC family protein [Sulfurovum sp.]|nr:TolC family protein [Sulfurovum sp.]